MFFQIIFSIFWSYKSTSLIGMLFAVVTKILASIFDKESILKYVQVKSFVPFHTFYVLCSYCLAVPDHHCHQVAVKIRISGSTNKWGLYFCLLYGSSVIKNFDQKTFQIQTNDLGSTIGISNWGQNWFRPTNSNQLKVDQNSVNYYLRIVLGSKMVQLD